MMDKVGQFMVQGRCLVGLNHKFILSMMGKIKVISFSKKSQFFLDT